MDPDSLDPRDFDLIEGLRARLGVYDAGVEIVWTANGTGLDVARASVVLDGEDAVWTELTITNEEWRDKGLGSAVVALTPRLFRANGIARYVILSTAADATDFFVDRGFVFEGDRLVGSTAPQGRLVKTARGKL